MAEQSMGGLICSLRRKQGMTQKELAEKMHVTDKAVSKWERDLSCPDVNSLPALAAILDVSVDELLHSSKAEQRGENQVEKLADLILRAVPLAMGIAVTVLAAMGEIDQTSGFGMLGIGMICMGISALRGTK